MKSDSTKTKKYQKEFFDQKASLYPWPDLLIKAGFDQTIKPREVKFKKYLDLLGMKPKERVLDVGCGKGIFLARIRKTYKVKGVGVDLSPKSIAQAKRWSEPDLVFQVAEATKLPFKNQTFDYVLSFDTLEHIQDQKKALSEMVRVLKDRGKLLIYTINKNQAFTWHFWLKKIGVPIGQRAAHNSALFLDPGWIRKELEKLGIKIKRLELFNSFFSLAADEALMLTILGFKSLNFFDPASGFKTNLGQVFLKATNFFSHLSLIPLEVLDFPWKAAGYSNSFFVLGEKR
jgi:ubiquinone/menaquinone biosynthesis C-methylase UbiE